MFILKSVRADLDEYYFMNNDPLVNEVINGYLLVCDLSDFKSVVAERLKEREQTYKQYKALLPDKEAQDKVDKKYATKIEEYWKEFQEKLNTIDSTLSSILSRLDYS